MNKKLTGALVATAVAGLFLAGNSFAQATGTSAAAAKEAKTVKCWGGNECKGKGSCKGEANACAGKNGCKGKAWINTTEADCKAKGGTVKE